MEIEEKKFRIKEKDQFILTRQFIKKISLESEI